MNRGTAGIAMLVLIDFCAFQGVDCEFFFELPPQSLARRLAHFDFASGKFPLQRKRPIPTSLARQNPSITKNQCRDDLGLSGSVCCHARMDLPKLNLESN